MKKIRKHAYVFFAVLIVVINLTGCGTMLDDEKIRNQTEVLLDALIDKDYNAFRENIADEIDSLSVAQGYNELCSVVYGTETYELRFLSRNTHIGNGIQQIKIRYLMITETQNLYVDVVGVSDIDGIVTFVLTPIQETYVTGTLENMNGANALQWGMLLFGIGEFVFVVWMFVDCIRHKFKSKAVWIAIILLCTAIFSVTISEEALRFNVNFGLFLTHTAWLRYSTGGSTVRIMVPIGAVLYMIKRKKIHLPSEQTKSTQDEDETITEE